MPKIYTLVGMKINRENIDHLLSRVIPSIIHQIKLCLCYFQQDIKSTSSKNAITIKYAYFDALMFAKLLEAV